LSGVLELNITEIPQSPVNLLHASCFVGNFSDLEIVYNGCQQVTAKQDFNSNILSVIFFVDNGPCAKGSGFPPWAIILIVVLVTLLAAAIVIIVFRVRTIHEKVFPHRFSNKPIPPKANELIDVD